MSVGKGSLQRAAKANDVKVPAAKTVEVKEVKKEAEAKTPEKAVEKKSVAKAPAKKTAPKASAKKTAAKAPAKKETTVVAASVISSDSIHEMKFQAVSKIHCDLPTYLL